MKSFAGDAEQTDAELSRRPERRDDAQPLVATPAISVVTTVYNNSKYIGACIQSVLSDNSYENYEMIVVDDGSSDKTGDVIRSFKHPRLRVFHCPRRGRGKALNFAISVAKGRYLSILDSDDLLIPGRLAQHVQFLDKQPDVSFVGNAAQRRIDSAGLVTEFEEKPDRDGDHVIALLKRTITPCTHSSVTYRVSTLHSVNGFTEWLPCWLDKDLYIRMAAHGPPALLPGAGSLNRLHESQYFRHTLPHRHVKRLFAQTVVAYRAVSLLGGSFSGILPPMLKQTLLMIAGITRTEGALRRIVQALRGQPNLNTAGPENVGNQ